MNKPDKNLKRARAAVSNATRYAPAIYGGNWKGKEYLSQCEHDLITRMTRLGGAPEHGVHCNITRELAMEIIRARRPLGYLAIVALSALADVIVGKV